MADQRIQIPVKVTDPTTPSQEQGVDASGNAKVILASNDGVDIGDVDVASVTGTVTVDSELPAAAALGDDTANPTVPGVGSFVMLWDSATWDRAPGTSADGMLVNLGSNNDVVATATQLDIDNLNKDDDEVLMWANTAKDGTGTDYVPLTDADGHLQVDVLSGGGVDSPTTPAITNDSGSAIAAGSSDTLTTGEVGTQVLWGVTLSASVAMKVVIESEENTATTTLAVVFVPAGGTVHWEPPHRTFASITASAGVDAFNAVCTNLDTSEAADLYASFQHSAS